MKMIVLPRLYECGGSNYQHGDPFLSLSLLFFPLSFFQRAKRIFCDRIDEDICEELVRGDRFVDGYFHSETAPLSIVKKITKVGLLMAIPD